MAETLAVVVIRGRRTQMLFAHVVPRKGLAHEHGPQEPLQGLQKLGYHEVILRGDVEPALRSVQEVVKRRREAPMIQENSGVGDRQANRAAAGAVQA